MKFVSIVKHLKYYGKLVWRGFSINSDSLRIKWTIKQLKKIPRGESIIDVGAGEMFFKPYCGHLKYTGQDLAEYTGKGDEKGLQTGTWNASNVDIVSDITKIPINNSSFNNAMCIAVLEHVPHPDLAIKEIARILKKGGRLIVDAPFCSQTHFSPFFFVTGFSPNWYKHILFKYGFKIVKIEPYGNYFDYMSTEFLRLPLMIMKYSFLGLVGCLFYLFIVPLVIVVQIVSRFSKNSEDQLCFGYHVVALKK